MRRTAPRHPWWLAAPVLALTLPFAGASIVIGAPPAAPTEDVVVVLRAGTDSDRIAPGLARRHGFRETQRYRHALSGFAASLTRDQRAALAADPDVAGIVPDARVELTDQTLPTGVNRVEADLSPAAAIDKVDVREDRVDADIAIIDTGIQPNHPDLNVVGGVNCTTSNRSAWADGNGHGTHVAGTAAALDNGIGVVGVAPGARLWSVRVFDAAAYSKISGLVCGIDWVTGQKDPKDPDRPLIEVVNMSLRDAGSDDSNCGRTRIDPEHQAICRSVAAGVTYVVAAGNDRTSTTPWRPASYNEVITVSALADFNGRPGGGAPSSCGPADTDDTFANFSNYGVDVDIIAPGKCIRSTYKGSSYATISGTSMASPAVAGGAALYLALHPRATPAEVRLALRAAGSFNWALGSDPDSTHEPLLDVSSFGRPPDFSIRPGASGGTTWAGVTGLSIPIRLARGNGFDDRVDLAIEGLPDGVTGTFGKASLVGLGGVDTTLAIAVGSTAEAGAYPLVIRGLSDALEHEVGVSLTVKVDATPPVVGPPTESIVAGTVGSVVPTRIAWAGADTGVGLARFDLGERRDGGNFATIKLTPVTSKSVARSLAFGTVYDYRVRGTDLAGNATAWVPGTAFTFRAVSEASSSMSYKGTWRSYSSSGSWGGRARYATAAGASATLRFSGREIAVVAPVGPTRGSAKVYLDGTYLKTISLHGSTSKARQVVFARSVAAGSHTLRIVVNGTAGHPRVDIDGFVVKR